MNSPHYLETELRALLGEAGFKLLVEGISDGAWFWNLERQEDEWYSDRFWALMGRDPHDHPHHSGEWRHFIHPDDVAAAVARAQDHIADPDGVPYDQVVRYRHMDGSWVTVRCHGRAIYDDSGRAIRFVGIHTDLTGRVSALARATEALSKQAEPVSSSVRSMLRDIQTDLRDSR